MRIIAGSARGVRLESPAGMDVRPTLDRVRESLFNILGTSVQDAKVLDLFAGTGAIGIEALSRGADHAVFVDENAAHLAVVERNLVKAKLSERARVLRLSIPGQLHLIRDSFDIVYADPPRVFSDYQTLAESIIAANILRASGRFILETGADTTFEAPLDGLTPSDSRTYGHTRVTIFT